MKQAKAFSCRYKQTFSIVIVAEDQYAAREAFIDWLKDRPLGAGIQPFELTYVKVVETYKSENRPIYIM